MDAKAVLDRYPQVQCAGHNQAQRTETRVALLWQIWRGRREATKEWDVPLVGMRVCYEVVMDTKTGRPRAENVQAEAIIPSAAAGAEGSVCPKVGAPILHGHGSGPEES